MTRKILIGALIGIAIGCTMELLFSALMGSTYVPGVPSYLAQFDQQNTAVLVERLIYAGLGAVHYCAADLYKNERWPLALATLVHAAIVLTSVLLAGAYLHWFPLTMGAFMGFLLVALLIYALVWVISFWVSLRETRTINAALGKMDD
ncbi:MAG: DUF3021 domain-containing protein [Rothia sp. (in: high G+C Gram-positive bacteria)]|nr:DUF3021 domain-containing protein [Rothia sp. (in: high G+C Gram-positive bacteria)]